MTETETETPEEQPVTYPWLDEEAGIIHVGPEVTVTVDGKFITWSDVVYQLKKDVPTADDDLARREVAMAYHDRTCKDGPNCRFRLNAEEEHADIMPALLQVALTASQLGDVKWATLLPPPTCNHDYILNDETIPCQLLGQHPEHQGVTKDGLKINWEANAPWDDTPEDDLAKQDAVGEEERVKAQEAEDAAIRVAVEADAEEQKRADEFTATAEAENRAAEEAEAARRAEEQGDMNDGPSGSET